VASDVAAAHATLEALQGEEEALVARREEASRKADYLRHVIQEVDAARLVPGEEERLELEARRLGQAGALSEQVARLLEVLEDGEGSARQALSDAGRGLASLERLDPSTAAWRDLLDSAEANLDELTRALREYVDAVEEDPGRLAAAERRRDLLQQLSHNYGEGIERILATRDASAAELEVLDTADTDLRGIAARRAAAERALVELAATLSGHRRAAGDRLARGVNRQLPRLGLAGGRFEVALPPLEQVGPTGAESIQFLVRLNAGMELRPLARVASGGELSRLMLALKVMLARHDAVPTLAFDEIDQGIGGEVGVRVGEALGEVSQAHQVLVITHLPQIAARADRHLVIAKQPKGGIATSDVATAHGEDRITELARMLGDPDADTARRHAMVLLATASATA
jgi:DNA repair protein RecN (Recombination protein N)